MNVFRAIMENSGDIVPFMKEVLKEGPSRNMVKIYALGSALTLLGMVGGMVEMILLPFSGDSPADGKQTAELFMDKKRRERLLLKSHHVQIPTEAEDILSVVVPEVKPKHLGMVTRRSSATRLHAS
ncbi:G0/G1 switch protein 2 isoform X2 [Oryzias latipes]